MFDVLKKGLLWPRLFGNKRISLRTMLEEKTAGGEGAIPEAIKFIVEFHNYYNSLEDLYKPYFLWYFHHTTNYRYTHFLGEIDLYTY